MKGICSCPLRDRVVHEFTIEVARLVQLREIERLVHVAHVVNAVTLVAQLYDE